MTLKSDKVSDYFCFTNKKEKQNFEIDWYVIYTETNLVKVVFVILLTHSIELSV